MTNLLDGNAILIRGDDRRNYLAGAVEVSHAAVNIVYEEAQT